MKTFLRFPLTFDAARLRDDASRFAPHEWTGHFNTAIYAGDWSGIALRAAKSSVTALYPDPMATDYADTENFARCSYVPEVLQAFQCETTSVRFLKLAAGAVINRHRDYKLGVEDGECRVHIPVVTNPQVEFILADERVDMKEGEMWYLNVNNYHSVRNDGPTDRIHLVIDCVVNEWLLSFF